jgi:hypothetical protein
MHFGSTLLGIGSHGLGCYLAALLVVSKYRLEVAVTCTGDKTSPRSVTDLGGNTADAPLSQLLGELGSCVCGIT